MQSKPEQFSVRHAEAFKDQAVVTAYRHRPPYPEEVFAMLADLITDEPRTVLDVGAGSGGLARPLVTLAERVDAVDYSPQMIAWGKQLPQGNHPHLNWIEGKVEDVPLTPPYALITAGSSIHWTEWSIVFPRFRSLLTPAGRVALVYRRTVPMPWSADLRELQARFSTRGDHQSADVVEELERRGFFQKQGERETAPVSFMQSIDDFIEGLHSRSGLARARLGAHKAADFDQQARLLLSRDHQDGRLPLQTIASVTWGVPEMGVAP